MSNDDIQGEVASTGPYLLLLVSLVTTLLLAPLMENPNHGGLLIYCCFTFIFVTCVIANRKRKVVFISALILAAISIPLLWSQMVTATVMLNIPRLVIDIVFFGFTAAMILLSVIKDHMSSIQSVFGAVCAYLLLGLTWALAYTMIEYIEADSFLFAARQLAATEGQGPEMTAWSQMVYYSFVTMTTLGFGDVAPRSAAAQTVTWMQAVTGQLFLAILVARLVSELPLVRRT